MEQGSPGVERANGDRDVRSGFYGWYVIVTLMLCQMLSFLDSKLPFILVEALKHDLRLTDTQIGLITGPAFSLTYAICALPIAKISDRYIRKRVICVAIVVWSGFTAAGGLANGFATFALSRIGVAIGESALTPAAHSIISGYTTVATRPRAMAIYAIGTAIGSALALGAGGFISDHYGWRAALFLVGGLGMLLMLLVATTLREPARRAENVRSGMPTGSLRSLFGDAAIRNIVLGGAIMGLSSGALNGWGPAYVMRVFHLSATETGASFGGLMGVTGITGLLLGGFVGGWLAARRLGDAFRMLAVTFILATIAQFASFIATSYPLFLVFTGLSALFVAFYSAPTFSAVQSLVDPNSRSFAAAVALFCINGLGIASGSFFAGVLSDLLQPRFGAESLRMSLLGLTVLKLWGAWHYYRAAKAIDLMRLA